MSIKGTPEGNFFEDNRDLRYVPEVAELIREYGEVQAGKYMWAIWLVNHPDSDLFDMAVEEKIKWVKEEYLKDPDFEWPMKKIVVAPPPKKKPVAKKKKKKGLDDDFDDEEIMADDFELDIHDSKFKGVRATDIMFEETGVHQVFFDVIEVFPNIAMSIEERDYYRLVRLRDLAMVRAEYLNGKDMASAIKMLSSSSPDMDKMKGRYLAYKESAVRSSGETQSGGISKMKGKIL